MIWQSNSFSIPLYSGSTFRCFINLIPETKKVSKEELFFIDLVSLLKPTKIDTNHIFNNVIKHIKVLSWTKLVFTELVKEPKE